MEELTEISEREDDLLENETTGETVEETKIGLCMKKLQDMVERPQSGLPGKVFACLSVLFVTITAVNLSISTMPDLREEEEKVSYLSGCQVGCAGKSRASTRSEVIDFNGDFAAVFRRGKILWRIFESYMTLQLTVRELIISSFMSKENSLSALLYITLLDFVFAT